MAWSGKISASHGAHLPPELVHRAGAEPGQFRRLADARSPCQLLAGPTKLVGLSPRTPQSFSHLAGLAHKLTIALDLGLDDAQAGPDALVSLSGALDGSRSGGLSHTNTVTWTSSCAKRTKTRRSSGVSSICRRRFSRPLRAGQGT